MRAGLPKLNRLKLAAPPEGRTQAQPANLNEPSVFRKETAIRGQVPRPMKPDHLAYLILFGGIPVRKQANGGPFREKFSWLGGLAKDQRVRMPRLLVKQSRPKK